MIMKIGGGETPPPISPRFARGATPVPELLAWCECCAAGPLTTLQLPPPVPPDGRAGFGFSSAVVLGSLRCRLSECGYFVSGNADGSFVVLVGPAHPYALMPVNNITAKNARDLVIVGHLRGERIARPVPAASNAGGIPGAATHRRTTMIRDPQWPREFLDRRLRTMKGIAKRRRNVPVVIGLRRRTAPRARSAGVTPLA